MAITETFTSYGTETTWTVPDGVTEITVEAWGAAGWPGNAFGTDVGSSESVSTAQGAGGLAAKAEATFTVSPGDTVTMEIAERANGINGGYPNGRDGRDRQEGFGPYSNVESGGAGGSTNVAINGTNVLGAAGGGGGGAATVTLDFDGDDFDTDAGDGGDGDGLAGGDAYASTTYGTFDEGPITTSADGGTTATGFPYEDGGDASNVNACAAGGPGGGSIASTSAVGGGDGNVNLINGAGVAAAGGGAGGENYFGASATNMSTVNSARSPTNNIHGEVHITYPEPPDPISSLTATGGDRQADLSWTNDPDSYDSIEVHRATTSGSADVADYTLVDTLDGSVESYVDSGLLDGEQYFYRVQGFSGGVGTGLTDEASATMALPAPTVLTHSAVGDASAGYSWTATHNNGDTRVEYRRAGEGDDWTTHETVARDVESATVDGLLNGEQYESRVVAQTEHAETEDT